MRIYGEDDSLYPGFWLTSLAWPLPPWYQYMQSVAWPQMSAHNVRLVNPGSVCTDRCQSQWVSGTRPGCASLLSDLSDSEDDVIPHAIPHASLSHDDVTSTARTSRNVTDYDLELNRNDDTSPRVRTTRNNNKKLTDAHKINEDNIVDVSIESVNYTDVEFSDDDNCDVMITGTSSVPAPSRRTRSLQNVEEDILGGDMLSDETINLAQNLLHQQFPEVTGLEDTTLGPVGQYSISRGPFLQLLHDPARTHWVCVSNIRAGHDTVVVYDSLKRPSMSRVIEEQVWDIVNDKDYVELMQADVQQQTNSTDCGVFAIAFATSLLYGQDPWHVTYDVGIMRAHLLACLEKYHLTPFPIV